MEKKQQEKVEACAGNKMLKYLKIWELLNQETDEHHPMTTQELIRRLQREGIACSRKTLYRDIAELNRSGYEVMCVRRASNEYYVADRKFSVPELRILVDAVQAASFITQKKTQRLVDKIANLGGSRSGEVLKRNVVAFNNTKSINENIYYAINEIAAAIEEKRKIEFLYFDYNLNRKKVYRKNGETYCLNPYATVFSDDNYYLIGYHGTNRNMTHYRVDRMDRVTVSQEPMDENESVEKFDIRKHKKQLFGMFNGREEQVSFVFHESLSDVMFDKFGDVSMMLDQDGFLRFVSSVQVSPQFLGWCCSFGPLLRVVSPQSVVRELEDYLQQLREVYLPQERAEESKKQ